MINYNGKEHLKKEYIYTYIYLTNFAIEQKITHCKSTKLYLKTNKRNERGEITNSIELQKNQKRIYEQI